jgi:4-aminobutyrate aminotransferase-like enzyme
MKESELKLAKVENMASRSYKKSNEALQKALKTIPLGSQTFSKSYQQFPQEASPLFLDRGEGGCVWDVDDNKYVDLICGLMPVYLGYKDKDVDAAIIKQLDKGISFSLATELEYKLSELMVDLIPSAEMVRYGKKRNRCHFRRGTSGAWFHSKRSYHCIGLSWLARLVYRHNGQKPGHSEGCLRIDQQGALQ